MNALASIDRARRIGAFIATKEHRRFVEFADAVRRDGYIGLWAPRRRTSHVELLVIDEADRLSPTALEHLRDRFDRQPEKPRHLPPEITELGFDKIISLWVT